MSSQQVALQAPNVSSMSLQFLEVVKLEGHGGHDGTVLPKETFLLQVRSHSMFCDARPTCVWVVVWHLFRQSDRSHACVAVV